MNVQELKEELAEIERHLGEQSDLLRVMSNKLTEQGSITAQVMTQSARSDVAQPAVEGILGAAQQAMDSAAQLDQIHDLLDTYAGTL